MKILFVLALALFSMQSFADRYEIGKDTRSIKIKASTTNVDVNFSIPVYRIEERLVIERVACRVPSCTTGSGNGRDGQWYNFFNTPKPQKAAALASAIKGVGKATAEKIVEFDLFNYKPDSWSAFKGLIRSIDKQLAARGFNYQVYNNVIEVHGYDNMISLGYGTAQSCTYTDTYCDQAVVREFRSLARMIGRSLEVDVKNQLLQSFETDTVEITAGNENYDVAISSSGYNKYVGTLSNRGSVLELDATRIRRAMPTEGVVATLVKDAATKNFIFNLNVPTKFTAEDRDALVEATYEVCRQDWFGGCFQVAGGPFKSTVENNKMVKSFTTQGLKAGSKYFVRVRLNKVDSQYYSNAQSDSVSTNSVKN